MNMRSDEYGRYASSIAQHNDPQRRDCLPGHVRFELRNVVANYLFERSHRFAGIQPNSGQGDPSRLSCSAGDTQLGAGFCRDLQQAFCTGVGHHAASPRSHELDANRVECRAFFEVPYMSHRERTAWLGREDSNLRMAESKSTYFT